MNTQDAIAAVQALINTAQSNVTAYQGQADSLTTILSVLQAALAAGVPDLNTLSTAIQGGAPAAIASLATATPVVTTALPQ